MPAGDSPSRWADDGPDLSGKVVLAVDMLAGANKDGPSDRGDRTSVLRENPDQEYGV